LRTAIPNRSRFSAQAPCQSAPTEIATVTAGNSGLQYDSEDVIYAYVWKTQEDWSGTCRQLNVRLTDGSNHTALFQFR
jgi:hypothetical protein